MAGSNSALQDFINKLVHMINAYENIDTTITFGLDRKPQQRSQF